LDEKNAYKGKFEIGNCSARRFYTFFDLKLRNQLNIVPIIGIDFSLANLTFED
jgi:outer membrane protein W